MTSKYSPLEKFLRDVPANQKEVALTFNQIEIIINDTLPPSAHKHQAWWSYEKDPHQPEKQAIQNAGWRVGPVNLREKWVRFVRDG